MGASSSTVRAHTWRVLMPSSSAAPNTAPPCSSTWRASREKKPPEELAVRSASSRFQTAWAAAGAGPGTGGWRMGQVCSHLWHRIHRSPMTGRRKPSWSGSMAMAFTGQTDAQAVQPVQSSALHSTGRGAVWGSGTSAGRGAPSTAALR